MLFFSAELRPNSHIEQAMQALEIPRSILNLRSSTEIFSPATYLDSGTKRFSGAVLLKLNQSKLSSSSVKLFPVEAGAGSL